MRLGWRGFEEESKSNGTDITSPYKKAELCQEQSTEQVFGLTFFCLWKCQRCLLCHTENHSNILRYEPTFVFFTNKMHQGQSISLTWECVFESSEMRENVLYMTHFFIYTLLSLSKTNKSNVLQKRFCLLKSKYPAFLHFRKLNEHEQKQGNVNPTQAQRSRSFLLW